MCLKTLNSYKQRGLKNDRQGLGEKIEGASEKQKGQKLNFKENKEKEWRKN